MTEPFILPLRWTIIDLAGHTETCNDSAAVLLADRVRHAGQTVKELLFHDEDREQLRATLDMTIRSEEVDAIVTIGSDGPAPIDIAVESAEPRAGKALEGFGRAVHYLAFDSLGLDAWMDRPRAWTMPAPDGVKLLFQLPDDVDLADLVWSELLWPHASVLFERANPNVDLGERFAGLPTPKAPTVHGDDEGETGN